MSAHNKRVVSFIAPVIRIGENRLHLCPIPVALRYAPIAVPVQHRDRQHIHRPVKTVLLNHRLHSLFAQHIVPEMLLDCRINRIAAGDIRLP